ncbi:FIG00773817: hypothetical protein [Leuconostoc inhae]|uniref:Uncharacterized protein n=1 Tax=Leuconostoc inhae TaxID=178001 RepID=A0AAN2QX52_9LACO|nr:MULTISPECIES: hypothetical protein [Leuconostoc]MBZ5983244.1 hypothetical protein [Leuconostoc gasicomitatum]MCT8383596.1 hypothetical protein [Leuconostoc mesenteroides]TOZ03781.1 hypothetical protein DIS14_08525 [Leuconostoc pseudomesenteroides]CUW05214.1 FIG00773817: hypothetical protein [Leuconostoc inhae]CUW19277.1 FIG00773817: hypothetical protein [Leuconostoc inhae]
MAIVNVKYMETLVRTVAVNVPDTLTDEQKLKQAIEIGKRHYFDEKVILGADALDLREISAEYKQETTDYEEF